MTTRSTWLGQEPPAHVNEHMCTAVPENIVTDVDVSHWRKHCGTWIQNDTPRRTSAETWDVLDSTPRPLASLLICTCYGDSSRPSPTFSRQTPVESNLFHHKQRATSIVCPLQSFLDWLGFELEMISRCARANKSQKFFSTMTDVLAERWRLTVTEIMWQAPAPFSGRNSTHSIVSNRASWKICTHCLHVLHMDDLTLIRVTFAIIWLERYLTFSEDLYVRSPFIFLNPLKDKAAAPLRTDSKFSVHIVPINFISSFIRFFFIILSANNLTCSHVRSLHNTSATCFMLKRLTSSSSNCVSKPRVIPLASGSTSSLSSTSPVSLSSSYPSQVLLSSHQHIYCEDSRRRKYLIRILFPQVTSPKIGSTWFWSIHEIKELTFTQTIKKISVNSLFYSQSLAHSNLEDEQ